MLVPSIFGYAYASSVIDGAAFPAFEWAMVFPTWAHCPVSMAFHIRTAVGHDPFKGRFRTADMSCIHLSFIFCGWAQSHGSMMFSIANACLNLLGVALLVRTYWKNERGGIHQMALVGVSILSYFSQMLLRRDYLNFV